LLTPIISPLHKVVMPPVNFRESIKGDDGKSIVGAAGLLAKFEAEKDRIRKANYLTADRRNVGGQNAGSNDARGSRVAARAEEDGKDGKVRKDRKDRKQGDKDKDLYHQFGNLVMGRVS